MIPIKYSSSEKLGYIAYDELLNDKGLKEC